VTIAAILLVYAIGVGTVGARILARASWPAQAPLLAILTCLAAAWSVVATIALAGLTLAVHATALGGALSQLIGACVLRLRATYATPGGMAAAGAGLVLTGAIAVRIAVTAASHLHVTRRHALRHSRHAEAQVERLVELHADDAATRVRDPDSLATALVVLAAAAPDPGPVSAAVADNSPVLPAAGAAPILASATSDAVPASAASASAASAASRSAV
jgi:hypothetical protein